MKEKPYKKFFESNDRNTLLKHMEYFGLYKSDIDSNGYVTLYHGGKVLPEKLKKGEIFFMTPSLSVAKDYAQMRKGEVFTLKVRPQDVKWNQGTQEVEFNSGGVIRDGILIKDSNTKVFKKNTKNTVSYKGISVGDIMPKTKWEVLDIVIHPNGNAQFLFKRGWYDADQVVSYEVD